MTGVERHLFIFGRISEFLRREEELVWVGAGLTMGMMDGGGCEGRSGLWEKRNSGKLKIEEGVRVGNREWRCVCGEEGRRF